VESNHRAVTRTPLAGEVAPTGHIFQAESEGVEPSGVTLARFSRPLADQPAPPSKSRAGATLASVAYPGALIDGYPLSLLLKDSNLNYLVQSQATYR
jgi:hypothetical protein